MKIKKSVLKEAVREILEEDQRTDLIEGIYKLLKKSPDKRVRAYASEIANAFARSIAGIESEAVQMGDLFRVLKSLNRRVD